MKVNNVFSVSDAVSRYSEFEFGRIYQFSDVLDPELIKMFNYRPMDESNVQAKIQAIAMFGIATPLVIKVDSNRIVFCVDGNHRLKAAILYRITSATKLNYTHKIPVTVEFLEKPIDQWDSGIQTQYNVVNETIVDRALRFNKLRERRNLKTPEIALLENCDPKRVQRTLAVLHFTPKLLELVQRHSKVLPEVFVTETARNFNAESSKNPLQQASVETKYVDLIEKESVRRNTARSTKTKEGKSPPKATTNERVEKLKAGESANFPHVSQIQLTSTTEAKIRSMLHDDYFSEDLKEKVIFVIRKIASECGGN